MQHLLARLAIVICGLFALMIATSGISFAVASLPTAEDVVRAEIKAEGQHNYQRIISFWASVQDNTNDQVYIVNTAKTYSNNAISYMAGTGLETATSHSIFVTQYGAGYYDIGNNHSGRMWQNGTHYWADNSKNWYWMCQYYYDNSGNTNNQPISTFYY